MSTSARAWDNGDGTYSNPMIHADYPDCEVIRVGSDYYYESSSFHWIPGDPILHSKDLVNWKPIGFAIPNYIWDKRYNLEGNQNRYGAGSWAPTLRYHDGTFYSACYVWTKGWQDGRFMITRAKQIQGPWQTNLIDQKLYDPGLFFDDDGKVYVVHGQNDIYVTELDSDLRKVITPPKLVYSGHQYYEGSHAYKINGFYYLFNTSGSKQHVLRSKSIYGPYEHKIVLDSSLNFPGSGLHQGALVDTPGGQWWAIIFQDHGKTGRVPFLLPVNWQDGWPMVQPVLTHTKPDTGAPQQPIDPGWRSDDFSTPTLGLQWQWNHQPVDSAWSLTERPGWLRLRTARVVDALRRAPNTLGMQVLAPDSGAVVKLDIANMKDGDIAGLSLFSKESTMIAAVGDADKRHIAVMTQFSNGQKFDCKEVATAPLEGKTLWLRAQVPYREYAIQYSYSTDGKTFTALGEKLGMPDDFFADWLAPRYAIFNYATKQTGGYVDVDSFDYILPKQLNNLHSFGDMIDTQFCDDFDRSGAAAFRWIEDPMPNIFIENPKIFPIATGKHGPFSWAAAIEAKKPAAWVKFNRVDFGDHAAQVHFRGRGQGTLTMRLNDSAGAIIAEASLSIEKFATLDVPLQSPPTGVQPIVIVFTPETGKTIVLNRLWLGER